MTSDRPGDTTVAPRPVPPGRHRREDGDGRAAARQHVDLGDHRRPRHRGSRRAVRGDRPVRARFLESRGYRRFLRGARRGRVAERGRARRRHRRMAPLDRRQRCRPRRARASGSPTAMGSAVGAETRRLVGPAQHPRDGRLGRAVRRAVRHGVGHHAQLHRASPARKNTSLAVVAPGIAEALFATAIGLFAAIPAVIALQSVQPRHQPDRGAPQPLRRRLPRDPEPRAGGAPDGDGHPCRQTPRGAAAAAARRWRRSTSRRWST